MMMECSFTLVAQECCVLVFSAVQEVLRAKKMKSKNEHRKSSTKLSDILESLPLLRSPLEDLVHSHLLQVQHSVPKEVATTAPPTYATGKNPFFKDRHGQALVRAREFTTTGEALEKPSSNIWFWSSLSAIPAVSLLMM
jgi:hypothetical protein